MSLILKNIPNILTLLRILLAPTFFILFIYEHYSYSVICFFIASVTDLLDGFLARKFNIISKFGKLYDPLADKILVLLAFVCMFLYPYKYMDLRNFRYLPSIINSILIVLVFRDLLITVLREKLKKHKIILEANFIGKVKTVMLLISIHSYLLSYIFFEERFMIYLEILFVLCMLSALFLSLWSSFKYIFQYRKITK